VIPKREQDSLAGTGIKPVHCEPRGKSMSDVTITDVMRAYARDAVSYARRQFDVNLDFSEKSLEHVDRILAERTKSGLLVPDNLSEAEREDLWTFCKMMGGYVGEVIIRNIGGQWQTKDLAEGGQGIQLISAGDIKGSPPEFIWRAITEPFKAVASYYRTLRAILGHGHETIENGIRTVRLPPLSAQSPRHGS
jgi:hypothetical protein